ncbi:hypothetical protein LPJ59_000589 [Coemansia sp. RSA 2399]|nr:hypothetical protein LPJ59_000589 [Coemansia sp. RSA 2399]KAJ1908353.1 hypothetical protein LPJ81_000144 [Coemansia sp. IMI 209127]
MAHRPPATQGFPFSNDKGCSEMALWKQESDLGPPQPPAMLGRSRLDCLAALSDPPSVQLGTSSAASAARPPTLAPLPHTYNASSTSNHVYDGYSNGSSTSNSSRRKPNYQPRTMTSQQPPGLSEPHIFVPRQPIVGHSAMSIDRSGDFIRLLPNAVEAGPSPSSVYDGFFSQAPAAQVPAMAPGQLPPVPMTLSSRRSATSPPVRPMPMMPRMAPPNITLPPIKVSMPAPAATSKAGGLTSIPETYIPHSLSELQSPRKRMRVDSIFEEQDTAADSRSLPLVSFVQEPQRSDSLDSSASNVSSAPLLTTLPTAAAPAKSGEQPVDDAAKPKAQQGGSRRKSPPASSTASSATPEKEQTDGGAAAETAREDERPLFNWQKLEVPEEIWVEAQELYDKVKVMKKVQNRQPICKRHAIHAALMFILCRNNGYPRTFAEICAAGNVTKREIGMYYNLMKQVLGKEYTSTMRAKPSEFLQRWCTVLELPSWIAAAATRVYDRADELAIVQGKCPISISAASLWLVIWSYNHRHALKRMSFNIPSDTPVSSTALPNIPSLHPSKHSIDCDQRDVCKAASVVIATLTSVFRLLAPHLQTLISDMLDVHL